MSQAVFSVVIPLHNKAHTIVDTLRSVLAQDFPDFEVIVVDDGSTDDSPQIVERVFDDSRITLIRQEHRGAGFARNVGVASARYELIAFLDADDIWSPLYLSAMRETIIQFPAAGMYCSGGITQYPDDTGYARRDHRHVSEIGEVDFFRNPHFFSNSSSVIIRKSVFQSVGGFPVGVSHNEDLAFFFKAAMITTVVFNPKVLTIYRRGIPGQMSSMRGIGYDYLVERSNNVHAFWRSLDRTRRDPHFIALTLYEMRSAILELIKDGDQPEVLRILGRVDPVLLDHFTNFELDLYSNRSRRYSAILWIYLMKIKWKIQPRPSIRLGRNLSRLVDRAQDLSRKPD